MMELEISQSDISAATNSFLVADKLNAEMDILAASGCIIGMSHLSRVFVILRIIWYRQLI